MGAIKKIAAISSLYILYKLATEKKYQELRDKIFSYYQEVKPQLSDFLDRFAAYLTLPQDVGSEQTRIDIDQKIEQIKKQIDQIDIEKTANATVSLVKSTTDVINDSLNKLKKK